MNALRKTLFPLGIVALSLGGCANLTAPSQKATSTVDEDRPTTGSHLPGGNRVEKVDVIDRDQIDQSGATTVKEAIQRNIISR